MLKARGLRREFGSKAPKVAVHDVDLTVEAGRIVCLLGPNGAGKTTTVKMCSTLLKPTSGTVQIDGIDGIRAPRKARSAIGLVLGGEQGFYGRTTARRNLLFFADVMGVPGRERHARVDRALQAVRLADRADEQVQGYSRGMRQRLHIARGMLNEPRLLLLDEPTNGLDPEIAMDIRRLVAELADEGAGVLLTTHHLAEAEQLADAVIVLIDGRVAVAGSVRDIARHAGIASVSTFSVAGPSPSFVDQLRVHPAVARVGADVRDGRSYVRVSCAQAGAAASIRDLVASSTGEPVDDLVSRPASLEEAYLALVERR